jgi:hypothetical protein
MLPFAQSGNGQLKLSLSLKYTSPLIMVQHTFMSWLVAWRLAKSDNLNA